MDIYCSSCKKNTANKDSSVRRTEQIISMFVSNCASFSKKKSKSIKNQEASGLLSELRISLWCCVCWQEDLAIRTVSGNVLKDSIWNSTKSTMWLLSKRISKYGVHVFWQENEIRSDSNKQSKCVYKWSAKPYHIIKLLNLKLVIESVLLSIKIFLVKITLKND